MGGQIAKLFIRGNLFNVTGRNLNPEQLQEVDQVCQMVFVDPQLQRAITEFCAALGRTIGNEYKDINAAKSEVWVSFWAAAINALHHRVKKNLIILASRTCHCGTIAEGRHDKCTKCGSTQKLPLHKEIILCKTDAAEKLYTEITGNPPPPRDRSIIENPIQRKKFFQTHLFNYLRQILRENQFPKTKLITSSSAYADVIAHQNIKSIIKNNIYKIQWKSSRTKFSLDTNLLSLDSLYAIHDIKEEMDMLGVEIKITDESITISQKPGYQIPIIHHSSKVTSRVHHISLDSFRDDHDEQDNFRNHLESQSDRAEKAIAHHDVDLCDSATIVRNRLCPIGQSIFDLIRDVPNTYIKRFGTDKIHKSYVAKFLGLSQKEINRQWMIIQMQMRAVGLVPRS